MISTNQRVTQSTDVTSELHRPLVSNLEQACIVIRSLSVAALSPLQSGLQSNETNWEVETFKAPLLLARHLEVLRSELGIY